MMRFWGGGVGHKSICKATDYFLQDRFCDDNVDLRNKDDENLEGVEEPSAAQLGSIENMESDEKIADDSEEEEEEEEGAENNEEEDTDAARDDGSDDRYADPWIYSMLYSIQNARTLTIKDWVSPCWYQITWHHAMLLSHCAMIQT